MNKRDFLSITDLTAEEIRYVLDLSQILKKEQKEMFQNTPVFKGETLVMIFEKPSLRTRLSFEIGMTQLGGHAVYLGPSDIGLDERESACDVARVASRMGNIIMARTHSHQTVSDLAKDASVPVINGLSNLEHPCQILADLLTILEIKLSFRGLKIAYVGDSENNVTHSLALASAMLGMHFAAASPRGYWMDPKIAAKARHIAAETNGTICQTDNPHIAVGGADIVYTDTWVSMGDESEKEKRLKTFRPYQVNVKLMHSAKPNAIFMHDLPAYRGNEVQSEVIDGTQSVVFQQAENRLHVQKALMIFITNHESDLD